RRIRRERVDARERRHGSKSRPAQGLRDHPHPQHRQQPRSGSGPRSRQRIGEPMPGTNTVTLFDFSWPYVIVAIVAIIAGCTWLTVTRLAKARERTGYDPGIAAALEENAALLKAIDGRLQQIETTLNEVNWTSGKENATSVPAIRS